MQSSLEWAWIQANWVSEAMEFHLALLSDGWETFGRGFKGHKNTKASWCNNNDGSALLALSPRELKLKSCTGLFQACSKGPAWRRSCWWRGQAHAFTHFKYTRSKSSLDYYDYYFRRSGPICSEQTTHTRSPSFTFFWNPSNASCLALAPTKTGYVWFANSPLTPSWWKFWLTFIWRVSAIVFHAKLDKETKIVI